MISYVRSLEVNVITSTPELIPVLVLIILYVYVNAYIRRFGYQNFCRLLGHGLLLYSVFFISCHIFLLATGYGFAPGRIRLAGVTAYPNFLGYQIAMFNTVIIAYVLRWWPQRMSLLLLAFFIAGLYLIFLSGSRTGFIMTAVGLSMVMWGRQKQLIGIASVFFVILGLAALIISTAMLSSITDLLSDTPLDRGYEFNTRTVVWGLLLNDISAHPIFGAGQVYDASASESSFLRGWATFGIFYLIGLCSVIVVMLKQLMDSRLRSPEGAMFMGLGFALVVGAIFDGYLEDRFSTATIFFILLGCVCKDNDIQEVQLRRRGSGIMLPARLMRCRPKYDKGAIR
jgi:hypothetical protein